MASKTDRSTEKSLYEGNGLKKLPTKLNSTFDPFKPLSLKLDDNTIIGYNGAGIAYRLKAASC